MLVGPLFHNWDQAPHRPALHTAPGSPGQCPLACGTQRQGFFVPAAKALNFAGQYWKGGNGIYFYIVYILSCSADALFKSDTYLNS